MKILDPDDEIYIVYIVSLTNSDLAHTFYRVLIALLNANKAFIAILFEYANLVKILFSVLTIKLLEYTRINNYTIELINDKKSPYKLIYSLESVKL